MGYIAYELTLDSECEKWCLKVDPPPKIVWGKKSPQFPVNGTILSRKVNIILAPIQEKNILFLINMK